MVILTDDKIVNIFKTRFNIPTSSMIYGTLESANKFWIRKNNGVKKLPYLAFYRKIQFYGDLRQAQSPEVRMGDATTRKFHHTRATLEYTVELVGEKVIDQIEHIKEYIFWANETPIIKIVDFDNNEWIFKVEFDEPDDTSDLEEEENSGRIVRTTLTFRVETILRRDRVVPYGWITKALADIYLYDGAPNQFSEKVAHIEAVGS